MIPKIQEDTAEILARVRALEATILSLVNLYLPEDKKKEFLDKMNGYLSEIQNNNIPGN